MKKKTAIERALDAMQVELDAAIATFEGQRSGILLAMSKLREQAAAKPARKAKPRAVPDRIDAAVLTGTKGNF